MKRTILYTLFGLLTLTACDKSDGPLEPSGNYSVLRFDFPQGNNPWDDDIVDIHDEYGTYVIYKDITDQDINRQWQSLGTSKPQTCDPVPAEDVQYYVDFSRSMCLTMCRPRLLNCHFLSKSISSRTCEILTVPPAAVVQPPDQTLK